MARKILENVYWVGVNDRKNELFESYWPIPEGISYNSYLISDEATALVDGVKAGFIEDSFDKITAIRDLDQLDYVIINHMEPDHTGSFPTLRRLIPDVEFVCTSKAADMLESFYGISEGIKVVEENDELDLGRYTLKFTETPFVHWPETMMTYLEEEQILFSGDGFGTFGALNGGIFDDQLDLNFYLKEAVRYLANIVGAYGSTLQAALKKLESLHYEIIAPTHGPVWRKEPDRIVKLYDRFSSANADPGLTIIYGSMYGFTEKMTEQVARGAEEEGVEDLVVLDAARNHQSYLLAAAWKRKGLIVGSPTYEARSFPPVSNFLSLAEKKKLKDKIAGMFGCYGWGGGSVQELEDCGEKLNWELVAPTVAFNGKPTNKQLKEGFDLGKEVAKELTLRGT